MTCVRLEVEIGCEGDWIIEVKVQMIVNTYTRIVYR